MLWFNLPYSKSAKTNNGKLFLFFRNKHFAPMDKYGKIFDRNAIKISYSCMPNIKSKISTRNKKKKNKINEPVNQNIRKCNCINKNTCPLNGNCLVENIPVYSDNKVWQKELPTQKYKGISENTFKKQHANHKRSFKISIKAIWNCPSSTGIEKQETPTQWSFSLVRTKRCSLCLNEKLKILRNRENNLLNKKCEIISKFCYQNKYMLLTLVSKIQYLDVT